MSDPVPAPAGKWSDLRTRILSAVVMVAVGAVVIWLGGTAFATLVVLLIGVMIWELARMTAPPMHAAAVLLGVGASAALVAAVVLQSDLALLFLAVPPLALVLTPRHERRMAGGYGLAIMLAGYGLIELRSVGGIGVILWLVAVVIASDVLGYFAGRMLGGPKFWLTISPKKTWSGTMAGWIGAALVGGVVVLAAGASWLILPFSALVALAGQMGDIAESWIKRRTGVKDSSSLIPGHGGVLDRFDALIGAVVLVMVLGLVAPVTGLFGG